MTYFEMCWEWKSNANVRVKVCVRGETLTEAKLASKALVADMSKTPVNNDFFTHWEYCGYQLLDAGPEGWIDVTKGRPRKS